MLTKSTHYYREMPEEKRPQDPKLNGEGWRFETLEHGGEYPDTMPQAIRATDAEGRSCIFVPVTVAGRVVDSVRFERREVLEPGQRPTVAELEAILNRDPDAPVSIMPDGDVITSRR